MINKTIKKIFSNEKIKAIPKIDFKSRPSDLEPKIYFKITELFEKK